MLTIVSITGFYRPRQRDT